MVEVIPQHTFCYEDGIPAYKSGEWPGLRPSHFTGSKLILKPISKKLPSKFFLAHSIHFPEKLSPEYIFRPCIRKIFPPQHDTIYRPKKRIIVPQYSEPPPHFHNNSNHPPDQFFSDYIPPLFQKKIRIAKSKSSCEFFVEDVMFRKKRISSLDMQRNLLKKNNPGDKNYKFADCSPDFFKEEGLIVGSTNKLKLNKTVRRGEDNFYQTLDLNVKVLDDKKLWKSKVIKEDKDKDNKYVLNLGKWEENNFGVGLEKSKKNKENINNDKNKDGENNKEDLGDEGEKDFE